MGVEFGENGLTFIVSLLCALHVYCLDWSPPPPAMGRAPRPRFRRAPTSLRAHSMNQMLRVPYPRLLVSPSLPLQQDVPRSP